MRLVIYLGIWCLIIWALCKALKAIAGMILFISGVVYWTREEKCEKEGKKSDEKR